MILHLLSDDKFSDYAINQFGQAAPLQNDFVVLTWADDDNLKFIKNKGKVRIVREGSSQVADLCGNLHQYKAVITHNLSTPAREKIIKAACGTLKTAWVFWGFELYSDTKNHWKNLGEKTKLLYACFELRKHVKNIKQYVTAGKPDKGHYQVSASVFAKLSYCLTDMKEDYEINSLIGMSVAVEDRIDLTIEYNAFYDNTPSENIGKTDTKTVLRLGYRF